MFGTEQILKGYRSVSPGERSVQSVQSGKHRAGFTEHRFTHDVPSLLGRCTEFARYRLSTFSYRTGMIGPNCLGSVPWGPNLLGSVQREPNSVRSRLNVLFPQLGSDRTETQVLEVLNANSNRTELDERAVQQFFRPVQS